MSDPAGSRCVVVTGGSRGIGLAIVTALADAGYRVVAVARREGPALPELARLPRRSGGIHFVAADLSDLAGLPALAKALRAEFGAPWGLVNNAGIGTPGVLAAMSDAAIERLVRMNVVSPLTLTRHVLRGMLAVDAGAGGACSGRIVNLSSIVASGGYSGLSVYSATKAALEGFTRSLAREIGAAGITVNAVAPGFVATEMTETMTDTHRSTLIRRSALRRLPDAADVAGAVLFLLGDQARTITGTVITVDAGATA